MELINKLPKSYKELNHKVYINIINKIPSTRPDGLTVAEWSKIVHFTTLGIMLGVEWAVLESLPAGKVMELIAAIHYLDVEPKKEATDIIVKDIDKLTYDEFVTYQTLRLDQWNNLTDIIKLVVVNRTPEQIENMSIHDAMQVFFCLKKSTKKYLTRLKYSTLRIAIIQTVKAIAKALRSKLKATPKTNLKTVGDG